MAAFVSFNKEGTIDEVKSLLCKPNMRLSLLKTVPRDVNQIDEIAEGNGYIRGGKSCDGLDVVIWTANGRMNPFQCVLLSDDKYHYGYWWCSRIEMTDAESFSVTLTSLRGRDGYVEGNSI